jgi:hypothetical protein
VLGHPVLWHKAYHCHREDQKNQMGGTDVERTSSTIQLDIKSSVSTILAGRSKFPQAEKFQIGLSVMAVFQQAEAYSFACSSHYGCLSVLKFGEDS